MSEPPEMDENPFKEVTKPGYYERARQRAERRKSPWNIILVPLVLGGVGLSAYILCQIMWQVHTALCPADAGMGLRQVVGGRMSLPVFLLFFPLYFASIPLGFLIANWIAWCIGPARQAFDKEASGVKGTSFRASQSGLWMIAKFVVPVCLLLSFIGALTMKNMP